MDRHRQPAMSVGGGAARPWADEPDEPFDDEWHDPTALSRGWAFARLVALVIACGLGAGITIGVTAAILLSVLNSSL
jgi:hypothetical protein